MNTILVKVYTGQDDVLMLLIIDATNEHV